MNFAIMCWHYKMIKNYKSKLYVKGNLKDDYLLTSDQGSWMFIDKNELNNLSSETLNQLEEKGLIITDNNKEQIKKDLRKSKQFLFNGPSLHIIILSLRCNHNCVYCHASSKPVNEANYDMTVETANKVIDLIFQSNSNSLNIEFQGGEPLLNFEVLKHIIDEVNKRKQDKNIKFSLVSNLVLMTDEKLDFLVKNNVGICTSLDGPELIHNKNRFQYSETIKWIKKINHIDALVTVTKDSLNYYKEIIDEYIKNNILSIHLRNLNRLGDARDNVDIYYSVEEFIEFWKKSVDYIIQKNIEGINIKERKALIILQKIFGKEPNYLDLRSPCGAIIGQVLYNYDGKIYTCDEGRMLNDDLFCIGSCKDKLKNLTTSDKAKTIISSSINDSYVCNSCVYKPFCGVCPVLNYADQGSIIGCIPTSNWCKLHMAQFDYIFEKLRDLKSKEVFMQWLDGKV